MPGSILVFMKMTNLPAKSVHRLQKKHPGIRFLGVFFHLIYTISTDFGGGL
ncbi:hypothetical protein SAMN05192553_10443 [Cyclobacterium xiamenense]|uniref:Uncharacterized protein n=1 Tax=Cyclobacterium xiamenense TaxID=1297121 RepID=A0A1H6YWK0_9BACT|nr:hypothetical protein SAMN05192553_10443 [Cyclobacterium xiamenense]